MSTLSSSSFVGSSGRSASPSPVPRILATFLRRFGFDLAGNDVVAAATQLEPMGEEIVDLGGVIRTAIANGMGVNDVVSIATSAGRSFRDCEPSIRRWRRGAAGHDGASLRAVLAVVARGTVRPPADRLPQRAPLALHALALLDVAATEIVPAAGAPAIARPAPTRAPSIAGTASACCSIDAEEWAEQAYGWGVAFDSDMFILRLVRIFEYLGGTRRDP